MQYILGESLLVAANINYIAVNSTLQEEKALRKIVWPFQKRKSMLGK